MWQCEGEMFVGMEPVGETVVEMLLTPRMKSVAGWLLL